jgi:hypothetical protein
MSFLLRFYKTGVSKFPYLAQGVQSSILMATGDAIAQLAVEKRQKLDLHRFVIIKLLYIIVDCNDFLLIVHQISY